MANLIRISIVLLSLISCMKKEVHSYHLSYSSSNKLNSSKKEFIFAPHPLHNPVRLQTMFGPIVDILNREIPEANFILEASKDYNEYNDKIITNRIDILMPNPYQTLMAIKNGYTVFGKMADDFNFRGIVLVRKESPIKHLTDLKNKTVAFPARTALAASMLPQYYLQTHGVNVRKKEINIEYVGSQESSVLSVYHKEVDAAATWPMTWNSFSAEKKELKNDLRVLFETDHLVNNSLMVKNNFDQKILEKIKKSFLLFA